MESSLTEAEMAEALGLMSRYDVSPCPGRYKSFSSLSQKEWEDLPLVEQTGLREIGLGQWLCRVPRCQSALWALSAQSCPIHKIPMLRAED